MYQTQTKDIIEAFIQLQDYSEVGKKFNIPTRTVMSRIYRYEKENGHLAGRERLVNIGGLPKIKRNRDRMIAKVKEVKELWDQNDQNMARVGEKLGISRERVRQLLKMYEAIADDYVPRDNIVKKLPRQFKAEIVKCIIDNNYRTVREFNEEEKNKLFAKINLSPKYIMHSLGINPKIFASNRRRIKKVEIVKEYLRIKDKIGRYPNCSDLQLNPKYRAFEASIRHHFGSFPFFVEKLGIKDKIQYPKWEKHIKRLQQPGGIRYGNNS